MLTEIVIPAGCTTAGKQIVNLGLPKTILISIIKRDDKFITPTGSTELEAGDRLFVLTENKQDLVEVYSCLAMNQKV